MSGDQDLQSRYRLAELRHHLDAGAKIIETRPGSCGVLLVFSMSAAASIGLCFPLADCHAIADKLESDGRAADAARVRDAIADFPRATWDELSRPMRDALLVAVRGRVWAPRVPTIAALERRGLAHDWCHTAEGLAVRDYARELVGLPAEDPAHVHGRESKRLLLPEPERSQTLAPL